MQYNFIITTHVRERYVERFSKESKNFIHLRGCRSDGCQDCQNLTYDLFDLVNNNRRMWDQILIAKLYDAEEIKIFNNNFNFMNQMYSKYGFDEQYRFLVEGRILFVICIDEGKQIVKTCMDAYNPVHGSQIIANFIKRPKYKKCCS